MDRNKLFTFAGFLAIMLPFGFGLTTLGPEKKVEAPVEDTSPKLPDPLYFKVVLPITSDLTGLGKSADVGFTLMVERSSRHRKDIETAVDEMDGRINAVLSEAIRLAAEENGAIEGIQSVIARIGRERLNAAFGDEDDPEPIIEVLISSFANN